MPASPSHQYSYQSRPPLRQSSYPPLTPSGLSHASSIVSPSIPLKRAAVGVIDVKPNIMQRKASVDGMSSPGEQSKKKRISLSCAQCESCHSVSPWCFRIRRWSGGIQERRFLHQSKHAAEESTDIVGAKRKQKCNREFPCQHCIARKVPELCVCPSHR